VRSWSARPSRITPEQRKRWLPGFCSGDMITAIAMSEPAAGSNLAGVRTTAVRDGDTYVLNGQKTFITTASWPIW
jgi:alkylation response protein AidB-like acyl-CoA dehydrogenase